MTKCKICRFHLASPWQKKYYKVKITIGGGKDNKMEKIRKEKEERNFIFYRLKTGKIQYHQVIKEKKTKQTSTYTEQNYQMKICLPNKCTGEKNLIQKRFRSRLWKRIC